MIVLVFHMRRFRLRRGLLLPFPFPGLLCHLLFLWNDGISISIFFYQRRHHFVYVRQCGLNFNRLNYAVSREGTESSGSFLWWCLPSKITLRRVLKRQSDLSKVTHLGHCRVKPQKQTVSKPLDIFLIQQLML